MKSEAKSTKSNKENQLKNPPLKFSDLVHTGLGEANKDFVKQENQAKI
jgi:hypothetical protein